MLSDDIATNCCPKQIIPNTNNIAGSFCHRRHGMTNDKERRNLVIDNALSRQEKKTV